MASSNLISNHPAVTNSDRARELTRKKKKKKSIIISQEGTTRSEDPNNNNNNQNSTRRRRRRRRRTTTTTATTTTAAAQWKSEAQQQVYSSKLLQALRHVRLTSSSPTSTPKPGRAVRQAADRVLAVAAKGKTRWSRAILTNRLKLKFMKNSNNNNNKRQRSVAVTSTARSKKPRVSILLRLNKTKNLPAVQRKARVLGRLVPGCRKEPLPVILEEATDYIAALEMQVRAMAALADLLSGPASSHPGSSRPPTT